MNYEFLSVSDAQSMLMKSKLETTWPEEEAISALYVEMMSWGGLCPPTKTENCHPTGNDFIQNYFTAFLQSGCLSKKSATF